MDSSVTSSSGKSTNAMLKQLSGLVGDRNVGEWEQDFIRNVWERSKEANRPDLLSPKQVEKVEQIWKKYFAG